MNRTATRIPQPRSASPVGDRASARGAPAGRSGRTALRLVAAGAGAVVVVVAAVIVVLAARSSGSSGRPVSRDPWAGSRLIADPRPMAFGPPAGRYRVEYRIEIGIKNPAPETEVLSVDRPFGSHLVTRSGAPPGGKLVGDQVSTLGKLRTVTDKGQMTVLAVLPDLAADDLRLDASALDLLAAGRIERRERRTVLGRECQVFRSAGPPQGSQLGSLATNSSDSVDSCISADGILLMQLRFFEGKLISRRIAVRLDDQPSFRVNEFSVREDVTITPANGGAAVVPQDPGTLPPGPSWFLDHPPGGFSFSGHYAVAEAAPPDRTGLPKLDRTGGFTDVFVRGPDVILLDQGGSEYGAKPFQTDPLGHPVDLGSLGQGEAIVGPRLNTVRVLLDKSRYVRLAGTLPIDQLVDLARSLRRADR
jgi:hypothetical protein